jgi:hypothetical protein
MEAEEDNMSAVTWESVAGASAAPGVAPVARPRLVSVPTGAAVPTPPLGRIRLTRAGRLVVTLGVALVLAMLAGWAVVAPSGAPEPGSVVTVRAGQTLSGIVSAALPGVDQSVAIAEVRELNDLASSQVQAGQVLVLPRH